MLYRVMNTLQDTDQLSEDRFVNTIYLWSATAGDTASFGAAAGAYRDFWDQPAAPSTLSVGSFITPTAHGTGSSVKFYNMADPTPRPVKYEQIYTFGETPSLDTQLPNEVCVCLTMKAVPIAGIKPASLRGRIYIGPFNVSALSQTGDDAHSRPRNTLVDAMMDAGAKLKADLAAVGWTWVIASRTLNQYHEVATVQVDNAWDTQRRRGIAPTLRRSDDLSLVGGGGSSGSF